MDNQLWQCQSVDDYDWLQWKFEYCDIFDCEVIIFGFEFVLGLVDFEVWWNLIVGCLVVENVGIIKV